MLLIVKLLDMRKLVFVALALIAIGRPSYGANSCVDAFKSDAQHSIKSYTVEEYHSLAKWLRNNANKIDRSTTHLAPAESLIKGILTGLEAALIAKKNDPLYAARLPEINSLLSEMRKRIADKKITYDYIFLLPYRLGLVTNTRVLRESREMIAIRNSDPKNLMSHEAFIKLLSSMKQDTGFRKNSWVEIYEELVAFPKYVHLPTPTDLTYRDMNLLSARRIYPIGISFSELTVDGMTYDEIGFSFHDFGHAKQERYSFYGISVSPEVFRKFEFRTLRAIEAYRKKSKIDYEVLQYIHFQIYHENAGSDWSVADSNLNLVDVISRDNIKNGIKRQLVNLEDNTLNPDYEGWAYLRDEYQTIFKNSKEDPAVALKRNLKTYEQIIIDQFDKTETPGIE